MDAKIWDDNLVTLLSLSGFPETQLYNAIVRIKKSHASQAKPFVNVLWATWDPAPQPETKTAAEPEPKPTAESEKKSSENATPQVEASTSPVVSSLGNAGIHSFIARF